MAQGRANPIPDRITRTTAHSPDHSPTAHRGGGNPIPDRIPHNSSKLPGLVSNRPHDFHWQVQSTRLIVKGGRLTSGPQEPIGHPGVGWNEIPDIRGRTPGHPGFRAIWHRVLDGTKPRMSGVSCCWGFVPPRTPDIYIYIYTH